MSRFTKLAPNAFRQIQINAGLLASSFAPNSGTVSGIIGVTSGGWNFKAVPTFKDYGDGLDNCPKNTMQLKRIDDIAVSVSGNFATVSADLARSLVGAADVASNKITPRLNILTSDFSDLWLVGDYSDDNSESTGGFVAIHMLNAMSTAGFSIQTADKDKGTFAFEYTAHPDYNDPDKVPFEIYVQEGTALGSLTVNSVAGTTTGKTAITVSGYALTTGDSYVYKTGASLTAADLPARGDSLASGWTAWDGSAEITATTGNKILVCIADSNTKAVAGGLTTVTAKS